MYVLTPNFTSCLQDQLVKILKDVLGHNLFVPEAGQLAREGQWLSPEALKHKVLVRMKVKPGRGLILAGVVARCDSTAGMLAFMPA